MNANPTTLRVLRVLAQGGDHTTATLAEALGGDLSREQLGQILYGLHAGHWVARGGLTPLAFGRRARLWHITAEGRARVERAGQLRLQSGALPHLLLSMACAAPQAECDLWDRVRERYDVQTHPRRASRVLRGLVEAGFLAVRKRRSVRAGASDLAFELTPLGEAELTRLPVAM